MLLPAPHPRARRTRPTGRDCSGHRMMKYLISDYKPAPFKKILEMTCKYLFWLIYINKTRIYCDGKPTVNAKEMYRFPYLNVQRTL